MEIGDCVRVINPRIYDDVECGDIGNIVAIGSTWNVQYQVRLIGKNNAYSSKGYYYFDANDIEKTPEDILSMYPTLISIGELALNETKYREIVNARYGKGAIMKNKQLLKGYKKAAVRFRNDTGYKDVWYAMYDDIANLDDSVLCMTGHHGEAIGTIVAIEPFENDAVNVEYGREIICKIDYSAYYDRQKKLKRLAKLKTTMAKKKAELDELAVYELLAKQSPEMANLLSELKELL